MLPEKRYTQTKLSGVEWLGEIPEGWEVIKIKYIAELNPKKSELEDRSQECSFIPMEKLKLGQIKLDETREIEDVYDGYTYFIDNDLLIAKVTPCFENKNFAIAENLKNGVGFGSSEIYVLRSNEKSLSKFLFYRLQEDKFMDLATYAMSGAGGLKRIPSDFLNNYKIALPPLAEQTAIADYLDRKTAHIDRLMSKQQTLLDKLAEERSALITALVTGKMDTNGKQTGSLKNSGVEWLGEIPEHWEVKRLKFLAAIQTGNTPKKSIDEYYTTEIENGFPWVKPDELTDFDPIFSSKELLSLEGVQQARLIEKNSILVCCIGNIGKIGVAGVDLCTNQQINSLTFRKTVDKRYSMYLVYSAKSEFEKFSNRTVVNILNAENQKNISFPLPPLPEQITIADYLDRETTKIDRLREKIEQSIDKLKEYRSTLITNAVTGKIKIIEE